jgi:hypothetical protein
MTANKAEHQCTERDVLAGIKIDLARTEERIIALDKRINGSIGTFYDHVKQGKTWRMAVAGIALTIVLEFIGFAFVFGTLFETVRVNERIIQREVLGGK